MQKTVTENELQPAAVSQQGRKRARLRRKIVGGLFLYAGGIHLGIVAAGPTFYASFAREAFIPLVGQAWDEIFMAAPAAWGQVLSLGEAALGVLLLRDGTWARVGWAGVITFHLALMVFGWGFWLWSVPALAFLIPAAITDWRAAPRA